MATISQMYAFCIILLCSSLIKADGALNQELLQCDDSIFARPDPMVVTGNAAYSVPPELTIISLGLDIIQPTASAALQLSANILAAAITAIKALGVLTSELATQNLSVNEQFDSVYDAVAQQNNQVFKGFQVSQTLVVTSKLVSQAGAIIDAAVRNGMNRVDSVTFDCLPATKQQIKDSLVPDAIADAKTKAVIALTPLGYRIVSFKDLSINDYSIIQPDPNSSYLQYKSATADTTVLKAETQVIQVSVTVTLLIEKSIPTK